MIHPALGLLILALGLAGPAQTNPCACPNATDVKIGGYLGQRLDACLEHNVKTTDGQYLTAVFKSRKETNTWQTEFWGKWMHSAVPLNRYSWDAGLKANIDASVKTLLSTQREDGYIGNYTDAAQLDGPWDVWGRKYTLLGLLHYFDLTGDQASLAAARRLADHLMTQVGPGRRDLYKVGAYHGMASCSVLEPIVWLYRRTGDARYLDFAGYVASQMEDPQDSARLVTQALKGVGVADRFPHPKSWWSWENGMKAYEMMSCYQGLIELYQVTGEPRLLDAAVAAAKDIMATEINAAGSGAAFECWYHGSTRETEPAYHMMETCVTTTWMRLCQTLLHVTRDPVWADQIEKSLYNALLAALSRDGATFSKYCPLEGLRGRGEDQCGMKTNCCIANGPRGFVVLLESILMADVDAVMVNLYSESRAAVALPNGNRITVEQKTDYPAGDTVTLVVTPSREAAFTLKLRIPAWSSKTSVAVNGEPCTGVMRGTYLPVARHWKAGDTVALKLELVGRCRMKDNHFALERGPITLARDVRFEDGEIHGVAAGLDVDKEVTLTPVAAPSGMWLAFTTPLRFGLNLEIEEAQRARSIHLCDFASAGNTWTEESAYRVWQRAALNVMRQPYVPYDRPEARMVP